ncbi:MAG TPA: DUF4019 domain-containing protein [Casimicrobiaceae bacterium]|nr:DUF4019 domain-containing protein [Casimicrobiaceae bacterium]
MYRFLRGRRAALAAISAWAMACALPAFGQDPRYSEAQEAAREWLAIQDTNDAVASYNAAAKRFHDSMPVDQWAQAMSKAHAQFGPVQTRALIGTQAPAPGPDVPPGEFVVVVFRTEFEKRQTGSETLTLERESDGKWRVVGYLMR